MLEGSHLDFADELRLDLGVTEDGWEKFIEVGEKNVHLVVNGRVQSRQSEAVIAEVAVTQHVDQQRHDHWSQDIIVRVSGIREGIAESRNDDTADTGVGAGEIILRTALATWYDSKASLVVGLTWK